MSQQPKSALSNLNVLLPVLYAMAIVLAGTLGNGRAVSAVAVLGGMALGLYYGFGRRRSRG
ncbi:hypothetical protein [Streptomyces sp. NPDC089919]|uniref:hypothetical protein n=1 Tax=Streptomyces sp. NPDC089919 TaxID=3155188 RepID=UPI0034260382